MRLAQCPRLAVGLVADTGHFQAKRYRVGLCGLQGTLRVLGDLLRSTQGQVLLGGGRAVLFELGLEVAAWVAEGVCVGGGGTM